ncbi:VIT1/CCC1 transporter family protein [Methanopyrus kandleri]|uniref:VIT1/CCC1 transporter family protein n=1 Tax=Methanopyrus kandleri TaxID=2320 RepID=UPI0011E53F36|nr:VIT1/CCC1 transporter family protein [Methanopyrus kandleri]
MNRKELLRRVLKEALATGRYMALGSMDGVLASMGAVLSVVARGGSAQDAASAGLSVAVALALSNGFGSYLGEKIEELREIRELERQMIMKRGGLEHTRVHDLARIRIYTSVVSHGGSSFMASMVPILPVLIIKDPKWSVIACTCVSGIFLFLLGVYLGRLCKERKKDLILRGCETAAIGGLVGLVTHFMGAH